MSMDDRIRQQYTGLYGAYVAGQHRPGETIRFAGGHATGMVIWSYQDQAGRLVYVVDDEVSGWPQEIAATEIERSAK